jgi:hypothetical protein
MHEVAIAIDAGHIALTQRYVRGTPALAPRLDYVRVITAVAGGAVLGTHFGKRLLREIDPACLPALGIIEIMRYSTNASRTSEEI